MAELKPDAGTEDDGPAGDGTNGRMCIVTRESGSPDELIRDIVQIVADELRLRPDAQKFIAGALDQRGAPAGGHRAQRVPGMTGDQKKLGGFNA